MVIMIIIMSCFLFEMSRGLSLCNMNEEGIEACKPSVSSSNGGSSSPVADPTPECCKALSRADLDCLCSYKNSPELPLLGIDPSLAMALLAKCHLPTPPTCNAT